MGEAAPRRPRPPRPPRGPARRSRGSSRRTGVIRKPVTVSCGGSVPSTSTWPRGSPISSSASRRAAATGAPSPGSALPPGKAICPGWCFRPRDALRQRARAAPSPADHARSAPPAGRRTRPSGRTVRPGSGRNRTTAPRSRQRRLAAVRAGQALVIRRASSASKPSVAGSSS